MWVLLGTVFVASLLGSLHCVGMCGPFAMIAGNTQQRSRSLWPAAAYSGGRLLTYAAVGLLFGSLGMALNASFPLSSWQQTATYVAGGLMVLVGVIVLARQLGVTINLPTVAGPLQRFLQRRYEWVVNRSPIQRAFLIGALTCLMPCGWLYTFALVAAGTGNPLTGALVMTVFWAGTVPVLTALIFGFSRLSTTIQRKLPYAMAAIVIFVGVFTIAFRAPVAIGDELPVDPTSSQNLVEQINSVDHSELPCCRGETE